MFSKIEVNGDGACELYAWLREQTGGADIGWNFEKFLIGRDGTVVERFGPMVTPEEIAPKVDAILAALRSSREVSISPAAPAILDSVVWAR